MARIIAIGVIPEKKAAKRLLEEAVFVQNGGLEDDFHRDDTERAVSFMGIETGQKLREQGIEGLCTSRFQTNITTEGIELKALSAGDVLQMGGAEVKITQVGKECFAECRMVDRSRCPLRTECAFGVTVTGGLAKVGDEVIIKAGS